MRIKFELAILREDVIGKGNHLSKNIAYLRSYIVLAHDVNCESKSERPQHNRSKAGRMIIDCKLNPTCRKE